jgi:Flp pilus assembly protein TadB
MNPYLVAGLIVLAIILTVIAMKLLSGIKTPAVVARVEAELVDDSWKLLAKTVSTVADGGAKKAALTNAQTDLTEHFDNVRKLKAAVAALPEA